MPVHAILGATGATGSAILRTLLSSRQQDLTINIFVRSKAKLLAAFPDLEKTSAHAIKIYTGALSDKKALASCLRNASVIYLCIATNKPAKVTTVARHVAESVNVALQQNRSEQRESYVVPTVMINRSLSLNTAVKMPIPGFMRSFFYFVLYDIYVDLEVACQLYESAKGDGLLNYIIIDPPALHNAEGRERTGHKLLLSGKASLTINYEDLGAAFVEAAERQPEFLNKAVGVMATGKVGQTWGTPMIYTLRGLRIRLLRF